MANHSDDNKHAILTKDFAQKHVVGWFVVWQGKANLQHLYEANYRIVAEIGERYIYNICNQFITIQDFFNYGKVTTWNNIVITVKANVVTFTADLPAKASMLNMNQFNGYHGCSFCYHPGTPYRTGRGGNVMNYSTVTKYPRRGHNMMIADAYQSQVTKEIVSVVHACMMICINCFISV